mmetsp:Transcript_13572/g.19822  ORF Transcript_13572/g.19822 Transcript_13572/m.19822 type:complete len:430 (+) Transcript_13572:1937-3226(+)
MGSVNKALVGMFLTVMLTHSLYSVIAPFFPQIAAERGIGGSFVGWVFSCYPIAAALLSPVLGLVVSKLGRKRVFLGGAVIVILSGFSFALLPLMSDFWFKFFALSLRLIQGAGGSALGTACFAIIASNYPDQMEALMGMQQTMTAAGMMIGPILGAALYSYGGFTFLFVSFSCVFSLFIPYACYYIPKDKPYVKPLLEVQLKHLIDPGLFTVGGVVVLAMITMTFTEPVLSEHLLSFGVSSALIGLFFTIPTVPYVGVVLFISKIPESVPRKHLMVLGMVISFIAMLLLGPWKGLYLPHNLVVVSLGLVVMGVGLAFSILPCLPELVKIGQAKLPEHNPEHVSDAVSGFLTFCFFVGEIVGPPLAGFLRDLSGFENAAAYTGGLDLVYGFIFMGVTKFFIDKKYKKPEPIQQELVSTKETYYEMNEEEV